MKIVYAALATNPKYNEIAQKLVKTFLEFTTDAHLVILTDDEWAYTTLDERITILEDKTLYHTSGTFNCNIKSGLLGWIEKYLEADIIILCDADVYLTSPMNNTWFETVKPGINVMIGDEKPLSTFPNEAIKNKVLAFNPDENKVYKYFIERCLVIRYDRGYPKFVQRWKELYAQGIQEKLQPSSEIFEINLAAEYANFPINDLGNTPIRSVLFTREPNGAIASALR